MLVNRLIPFRKQRHVPTWVIKRAGCCMPRRLSNTTIVFRLLLATLLRSLLHNNAGQQSSVRASSLAQRSVVVLIVHYAQLRQWQRMTNDSTNIESERELWCCCCCCWSPRCINMSVPAACEPGSSASAIPPTSSLSSVSCTAGIIPIASNLICHKDVINVFYRYML